MDKTWQQHLFARVWDRQSIYRCITRATQLPSGEEVREWYNDYAIFLSTYTKDITPDSGEDSFFTLCATYTGFILPYERLKAWLTDHHQDIALADEIFTGLIAEVTQQESKESDNEFVEDNTPISQNEEPQPQQQQQQQQQYKKKTPTNNNNSTNNNTSPPTSSTPKTSHPPRRGIIYPYEIKALVDSTLYFLDRDTMFS